MDNAALAKIANQIRKDIIKMLATAGSGHPGGALGMADIFAALYFKILGKDDKLILSNGHICPVRYAAMAEKGEIPKEELNKLRKLGSPLQGHPERKKLPLLETTSGPLGSGLGQAAGMALAARLNGTSSRIYCVTSDGEHDEGNHWEVVLFAAKYKLANLTQIVDRNKIQIDGPTEEIMPLEPLREKYSAFGWNPIVIDGHNFDQIKEAVEMARAERNLPTVIIAQTTPGRGVSFMENNFEWHGKAPSPEEAQKALQELEAND